MAIGQNIYSLFERRYLSNIVKYDTKVEYQYTKNKNKIKNPVGPG